MNKPTTHRTTDDALFKALGLFIACAGGFLIFTQRNEEPGDYASISFAIAAMTFGAAYFFAGRRCAANVVGQSLITLATLALAAGCFLKGFYPSMS